MLHFCWHVPHERPVTSRLTFFVTRILLAGYAKIVFRIFAICLKSCSREPARANRPSTSEGQFLAAPFAWARSHIVAFDDFCHHHRCLFCTRRLARSAWRCGLLKINPLAFRQPYRTCGRFMFFVFFHFTYLILFAILFLLFTPF